MLGVLFQSPPSPPVLTGESRYPVMAPSRGCWRDDERRNRRSIYRLFIKAVDISGPRLSPGRAGKKGWGDANGWRFALTRRGAMSAQEVRNLIKRVMSLRQHAVEGVPDMGHVIPDLYFCGSARRRAFGRITTRIVV